MSLTDAAKSEIAEAIRIVREDRFERFARGVVTPKVEKEDELIKSEDDKGKVTPPPEKEKEDETKEEDNKPKSKYWGEIFD